MSEMLNNILTEIWENNIKDTYEKGEICTEHHLQAELYYQIKNSQKLKEYRIWVEPTLDTEDNEIRKKLKIKPDLILTFNNTIQAIIELKFKPDGEVHYTKDIEKFKYFSQKNKPKVAIRTNEQTGRWDSNKPFQYSHDVLFVFAVIAKDDFAHALNQSKWEKLKIPSNFLHLVGKINEKNIM